MLSNLNANRLTTDLYTTAYYDKLPLYSYYALHRKQQELDQWLTRCFIKKPLHAAIEAYYLYTSDLEQQEKEICTTINQLYDTFYRLFDCPHHTQHDLHKMFEKQKRTGEFGVDPFVESSELFYISPDIGLREITQNY